MAVVVPLTVRAAQLALMRCPAPPWARRLRSTGSFASSPWCNRPRAGFLPALPLVLLAISWSTPAAAAAPPSFDDSTEARSQNGAILLSWDADLDIGAQEYELQEADDPSFEHSSVRYRGSFPSFFVSGCRDGTRYFRVRSREYAGERPSAWSEWSATKVVVVEHHDLGAALGLFGGGAAVFLATGLTLLVGARAIGRDES